MAEYSSITFVIPCLNEEGTLPEVLGKINHVCENELRDIPTEVLVSDNGSTDNSIKIAESYGVRVVSCTTRGYGAALLSGIENASHEIIIFADADNTYDFLESPRLIEEINKGFDLVIGSRFDGKIHHKAMPLMHRYVGTPILNWIINHLYGRKDKNAVRDCNSGFRCFRRDAFLSWNIQSTGMEFASEMLVKALKCGASFSHVPVSLHADNRERVPHLHRWRDGMRHLLQIIYECPRVFCVLGMSLFILNWLVILIGLFWGPLTLKSVGLFGINSMLFGFMGTILGTLIWAVGLYLTVSVKPSIRMYQYLIQVSEEKLFWGSVISILFSAVLLGAIVVYWGTQGFMNIHIEKITLGIIALASNIILLVYCIITSHLLKKIR